MKIIDLLNKIANDELGDTKFEYDGDCFKYYKSNHQIDRYEDDTYETVKYYNDSLFMCSDLNDEIEIIEEVEDKEYECIEELDGSIGYINWNSEAVVLTNAINALIRNQKKILERLDNDK